MIGGWSLCGDSCLGDWTLDHWTKWSGLVWGVRQESEDFISSHSTLSVHGSSYPGVMGGTPAPLPLAAWWSQHVWCSDHYSGQCGVNDLCMVSVDLTGIPLLTGQKHFSSKCLRHPQRRIHRLWIITDEFGYLRVSLLLHRWHHHRVVDVKVGSGVMEERSPPRDRPVGRSVVLSEASIKQQDTFRISHLEPRSLACSTWAAQWLVGRQSGVHWLQSVCDQLEPSAEGARLSGEGWASRGDGARC